MRIAAVARVRSNWLQILLAASLSYIVALCALAAPVAAQAGSLVGATVCTNASTITLDAPVSDSVVTAPTVALSGSVTQSSQVEVRVDGAFDSTIQLSVGQTTYSGSVQLTPGTHTIEVTAISVCPGTNGTASSVVTYEAPPQTPSTGGSTPTDVGGGGGASGGVTVDSTAGVNQPRAEEQQGGILQQIVVVPLRTLGSWLNINQHDTDYAHADSIDTMGTARAVAFGAGLYLAIIGLAPSLLAPVAALPVLAPVIPGATPSLRVRWLGRAGRILGLLLVLGTLLL